MAKRISYLLFLILTMNQSVWASRVDSTVRKAQDIIKRNAPILDSVSQLLVVFNENAANSNAVIVAFEKKGKRWKVALGPIDAGIGRNGFAAPGEKREGDSKSPTGFFRFGQLFCYENDVDTRMPYRQTTSEDKWIDDPESPDYNKFVIGSTSAKSYENMKISSDEYKRCMVIEYNMHPIVKGMGSAIFMHLSLGNSPNSSSGCVVITPENMAKLLKWMKPEARPSILMGTLKDLHAGLE